MDKYASILIVDDEKSICEILAQFLTLKGYKVYLAGSAEEAIKVLKADPIDIVLSDIKMPGLSGVDLLKWIREYNPSVPVLLTTGFPTLDTAIEALKLGAYDYLTKPFHLEEIWEKIKRALTSKKLEEENVLFSKLVSLHEVTKVLASTLEIDNLNTKVLDFSARISRADAGALMLYSETGQLEIVTASPPPFDASFWNNIIFFNASAKAAQIEEPLFYNGLSNKKNDTFVGLPDEIQSYVVFPLRTPKRKLGVLNLIRIKGRDVFSNTDLEIINVLASQASISIENVKLTQNIRDNYLKTIRAFACAVEVKDRYTHGHSENVMKYTVLMGQHLGLSDVELDNIKYAGLLHDVGKIGINEAILNKPGKLTKEEFDEIKKHPELGARIISEVPFLEPLTQLVLHHHEFFNGKGYPAGLSGQEIPFGARILTIADAYEAMTSDRPYRVAMPQATALGIIAKESNNQFDPDLAKLFIEIISNGSH
jgi:response regulator RpfG family c-di-GMP phosphodiesterase